MKVIGEKINATRRSIRAALADRDAQAIVDVARAQVEAGADLLDVNGGDPDPDRERDNMIWLVDLVQAHTDVPLCVDSANPDALLAGLKRAKKTPLLNSVTLERDRWDSIRPLLDESDCMVTALLISDDGPPKGVDDRLAAAEALIDRLAAAGRRPDEIVIDPCFLAIAAEPDSGRNVLRAIAEIRRRWPDVHIGGGVSNSSFGLPARRHVNLAALCQAIHCGMDYCIIDPCSPGVMGLIHAAQALAGRDEFCMDYVRAYRDGRFGD